MRNWILIVIAVAAGGIVSTTIIMPSHEKVIENSSNTRVPTYSGNPLLQADKETLDKWYSGTSWNCGAELYIDQASWVKSECISQIISRVKADTSATITPQDVLNPSVADRWLKLNEAK